LLKNDGKGNFALDSLAFPANDMNISVAVENDFDGDGDLDLFVGSKSVPYKYGVSPTCYLYLNDGNGHFKDVAKSMNPAIAEPGMVTGAVWVDVTGDNKKELIITGEWMATRIFSFNGNKFDEITNTTLSKLHGWWQTITAADVNGDGKEDMVIGNLGENFYLKPDSAHPVKMWLNDFDQSGSVDQFRTKTINGKDMPVFVKRDVTDQFPALKKSNLKNTDYASKTIQDLFSKEMIDNSTVRKVNYNLSILALNNGNGNFIIKPLPARLQMSSVNAVALADINNDQKPDIIAGGNKLEFPPQFGRLDASYGDIAVNRGEGYFEAMAPAASGMALDGKVTDIKVINGTSRRYILVVQNDRFPTLYELKK
jgi:hypothetical protein